MGFFEKRNPKDTKKTVAIAALIGALGAGAIVAAKCYSRPQLMREWPLALVGVVILGAVVAAMIEWQSKR